MTTHYTTLQEAVIATISAHKIDHPKRVPLAEMQRSLDPHGIEFGALLDFAFGAAEYASRAHHDSDKRTGNEPCPCRLCELVAFVRRERDAMHRREPTEPTIESVQAALRDVLGAVRYMLPTIPEDVLLRAETALGGTA